MFYPTLYLEIDMHPHYLVFMGRNLEYTKKLTPVRIMDSVGMDSEDIMNYAYFFQG